MIANSPFYAILKFYVTLKKERDFLILAHFRSFDWEKIDTTTTDLIELKSLGDGEFW